MLQNMSPAGQHDMKLQVHVCALCYSKWLFLQFLILLLSKNHIDGLYILSLAGQLIQEYKLLIRTKYLIQCAVCHSTVGILEIFLIFLFCSKIFF